MSINPLLWAELLKGSFSYPQPIRTEQYLSNKDSLSSSELASFSLILPTPWDQCPIKKTWLHMFLKLLIFPKSLLYVIRCYHFYVCPHHSKPCGGHKDQENKVPAGKELTVFPRRADRMTPQSHLQYIIPDWKGPDRQGRLVFIHSSPTRPHR